MIRETAHN